MNKKKRKTAFISYAKEDRSSAVEIQKFLYNYGLDTWIDVEELLPGQTWEHEIKKAISQSDFFIACLSKRSVTKKGYVQKELKIALSVLDLFPENHTFVMPIRLDDCPIPTSLQSTQYVDWGESDSRVKLLLALDLAQNPFFYRKMIEASETFKKKGIMSILNSLSQMECLELYLVCENVLSNDPYYTHSRQYTIVDYIDTNKGRQTLEIDNDTNCLRKVREVHGLGDLDHYIRKDFIAAIKAIPIADRERVFGVSLIKHHWGHGSRK